MKKLFLIPLMLLLTSSTLGNMAARIPEWLEELGAE